MYKVCSPRYSMEKNKYQFTYPPIPKKTVRCLERRALDWYIGMFILGMATSTRLTGYSIKHPIIEYQNRHSVTRKTFLYENNDKIFRTINN